MAQQGVQLDGAKFCCSICLDLLKDPVTIPCGHSYCMSCIKSFWDGEDEKKIHSCPQCRQTFTPRPVLVKNTMFADLLEELKKTGLQAAPADHCYAGPEDVACDFCTGRKLKALKSCLVCLASYCEKHLQSHYNVGQLKKHKLIEATAKLHQSICSRHDEVMKIFCRTDQQCICSLCCVGEHKGHDTVSAAAERTERQRELEVSRQQIQQRIQDKEKNVKLLQQEVKAVNHSADKAVEDSEKIFTELIRLIQQRRSDMRKRIRSQQKTKVNWAINRQEKLEKDIFELRKKDAELKHLSHTEDHTQFLQNYPSSTCLSESLVLHCFSLPFYFRCFFKDIKEAVSETAHTLENIMDRKWTKPPLTLPVLPSNQEAQPKTRAEFLQYSRQITLDPNTANIYLSLSEGHRKATKGRLQLSYSSHPDRFIRWRQVLSRESLTGRCYWEVERDGRCAVAVTYKDISRTGTTNKCTFGYNGRSWALDCCQIMHVFRHKNNLTVIPGPRSSRVGVFLDHRAGVLSFYSVSKTMTLLHRVQTTFTQPLYAGLQFYDSPFASTAEFCKLD